ncbi:50S ribosomal protein L2 (plastid) [Lotharella oceanica]|uniref:Large ribosomal subunit protein uL2m n=1 Tax=Lotharella oceanica TaxID=641309 RepID=A0A059SLJ9_9EUKA|nr:50S ribosomal protein L2 [Lotharella oceanica]
MRQKSMNWVNDILLISDNSIKKDRIQKSIKKSLDFKRNKMFVPGKVLSTHYSSGTTAKTCLVRYVDGETRLMLSPNGLTKDDAIISGIEIPLSIGNHLLLKNIPLGTDVHNVELYPGHGGQLARAGGACINVIAKEGLFITLRLPSGEVRLVSKFCWATIGRVDEKKSNKKITKAGQNRWVGRRPHVRGVVKNPVDHPHGGGEGRSPIGRSHPVTPWGRIALGQRTRKLKRYSDFLILLRRK